MGNRVIFYIDGFNFYFGLREKFGRKYLWINLEEFAGHYVKGGDQLAGVKYFTARVTQPPDKHLRQSQFIDALKYFTNVKIFYGVYYSNMAKCKNCGWKSIASKEKKTDVNIATEMLMDAFTDEFDKAILISGDSDLVPPVIKIKKHFPKKKIIILSPPARNSKELKQSADANISVFEKSLKKSQFNDRLVAPNGAVLNRPQKWL